MTAMKILFIGLSHHGGLMRSESAMPKTYALPVSARPGGRLVCNVRLSAHDRHVCHI
jgi:hypothetical protein